MKLVYLKGKRADYGFMAFAKVIEPETITRFAKSDKINMRNFLKYRSDSVLRFYKREASLRSALRRIRKQNYEKGTVVHLISWYVGHADILVFI